MRFFIALLSTNLRAAFAMRTAFWMQTSFMALNNLLFCVFWWVLFERFDHIRGWRGQDVAILFGISAGGFGLAAILAGGVRDLARRIVEGELDPMLTLPRRVIVQAAAARTHAAGIGDIVSGLVLVGLSGHTTVADWGMTVVAMVLSAVVFVASSILVHSTAFWLGNVHALAQQVTQFILTFSIYPPSLFGGVVRVALFTILPAAFVSYLPARLVRDFDVGTLALVVGAAVVYGGLAWWVFDRGLRRYTSGSRFGVRD